MSERFKYSEGRLAEVIGVDRDELRATRGMLREGRDWKKIRGQVLLSEGSANYVAQAYGVKKLDLEQCLPVHQEPQQPAPEVVESNGHFPKKMRVVPPKPFNPRIVLAQDDEGNREIVWVGRNENFCFNDEIEVEPHETQTGILQCVSEMPRDRRRPLHR